MRTTILSLLLLTGTAANIFATNTKTVTLKMLAISGGLSTTTQIYFANGTSSAFIAAEDSKQKFDTVQTAIYSYSANGVACNSNGFGDLATSDVISLGYQVQQSGSYIFSATAGLGLDAGSVVILEDRLLGTFTNLVQRTDTFQLLQSTQSTPRFYLHISAAPLVNTVTAGCKNNEGVITVNQDNATHWSSISLFDGATTKIVQSVRDTAGTISFAKLPAGGYFVSFFTSTGYSLVKRMNVDGNHVQLSISASAVRADVGQTIQFFSTVSNSSIYSWNFGDSSAVTDVASPSYDFNQSGTFNVSLHVINEFQCTAVAYISMPVGVQITTSVSDIAQEGILVYSTNKSIVISNNNVIASDITCEVYNLAGQLLVTLPVTSTHFVVNMAGQSAGMYVVQMKTVNGNFSKKIFVANS